MTAQLQDPVADRLLRSSARHSYDPNVDIDWDAPIADDLYGMQPEWTSLYRTPLWDGLSEEQRITLSRHECASVASVGLWFELILMQMMLRDLYDDDPTSQHMHYALTEVADECRHSTMFGKAIAHLGIPAYGPVPTIHKLGRRFTKLVKGPAAYAAILVAEETLDTWQRDMMNDERVLPVSRMVARIHVTEEARHMTFAREEIRREMSALPKRKLFVQQQVLAQCCYMVARALVNPAVYRSVGIDPAEGRRVALANPHYRATMQKMGAKPLAFLDDAGLISAHTRPVWRASLLMP